MKATECASMIAAAMRIWLIAAMLGALPVSALPEACARNTELYQQAGPLLHTFVEVKAYGDTRTETIIADVFSEMARINDLLNNYNPESEVSVINASAGIRAVPLSPETFAALNGADTYARLSRGAFDFTVGPLVSLWGFACDNPGTSGPEPDRRQIAQARRLVDYRKLQLRKSPDGATAMLKKKGMRIDAGAFAKGFVADRAINYMQAQGIDSALVAAGGTIRALGSKPDGQPWQIGIRHPRNDSSFLTVIPLRDQSVSTSGDYEKFYYKAGKRRSHIIDPRTGNPVSSVQSVTVIATSGIASDALSTALFVLGPVEGLKLIEQHPGFEALIVDSSGNVTFSSGWPQKKFVY